MMTKPLLQKQMNTSLLRYTAEQEAVLQTLAYFDIFQYPLTKEEIQTFSNAGFPVLVTGALLEQMQEQDMIFYNLGFYSLHNNLLLSLRRRQGNEKAARLLEKAQAAGRFLYRFPFVRAVGISGSLSKNFADEKADIDFFILCKKNRLWIARTLMHLFKKLTYLAGRQHYYCMNYYVDEQAMCINEENIYTAIELKTLLPVCGEAKMKEFFASNTWTDKWLPCCSFRQQKNKDPRHLFLKKTAEWFLNNRFGNWLNDRLHHITASRWQRKQAKQKKGLKSVMLITGRHYCYSNAGSLREKILDSFDKKLAGLGIIRQHD